jgi:hypothetical protein
MTKPISPDLLNAMAENTPIYLLMKAIEGVLDDFQYSDPGEGYAPIQAALLDELWKAYQPFRTDQHRIPDHEG